MNLDIITIHTLVFCLTYPYMILGINLDHQPSWVAILFFFILGFCNDSDVFLMIDLTALNTCSE